LRAINEALMRLLLLRHALADPSTAKLAHSERRQLRRVVYRLRRLQRTIDVVACGAGPGAAESADLVASKFGRPPIHRLDLMKSNDSFEDVLAWLSAQPADAVIALIEREPALGRLAGVLTGGTRNRMLALQTWGVCRLECDGASTPAAWMLRWLLTPRQLNALKI
jgi:phosphohistidine phosphatase SixA